MMVLVFGSMLAALLLAQLRHPRAAVVAVLGSAGLALHLFLWEIHSPDYGYAIPWLNW